MSRVLAISMFTLTGSLAFAQNAGVELRVEARTIEVGETIAVQLICTNTGQPETPSFDIPAGLTLQQMSSTPSTRSMTSIFNGRRSSETTYTFSFKLTGNRPGTYTLGPFVVEADGSSFQTTPVRIAVHNSKTANVPVGDKLVFLRLEVNRTSLYVTETVEASLTIGVRKVYVNGRVFEYDRLLRSVDASASTLSVFGPQFSASERRITDSQGVEHEYLVYRDRKEIRTDQVGDLTIGPVFLKVDYPTSLRRSFWGRGLEPSRTQRVTARASAIAVAVKGPPTKGRPADFTGAIGRYAITATAKPLRVTLGQPVTLTLSIRGEPIDGIAGPDLTKQPDLVSRFEFATGELRGDVERSKTKVFRRAIFPKQQGEQTIPPVRWSYFDPRTEKYVTLATVPIPINVDPLASGENATIQLPLENGDDGNNRLTVLRGGISPNVVDASVVLADHGVPIVAAQAGAIAITPPALYLLFILLMRHRARLRGDLGYARRRKARSRARAAIAAALRATDRTEQLEKIAHALTAFIADVFNLPPGELTPPDVETTLREHRADEDLMRDVVAFLRQTDAIRYAASATNADNMEHVSADITRWMDLIEKTTA